MSIPHSCLHQPHQEGPEATGYATSELAGVSENQPPPGLEQPLQDFRTGGDQKWVVWEEGAGAHPLRVAVYKASTLFLPWVCLLRVAGARRGCVADGGSGVRGSSSRSSFALDLDPVT